MTNSMRYHRLLRQKAEEHTIKYNKSTTKTNSSKPVWSLYV